MNLFVYGTLKRGGPNGALLLRFKHFPARVHGHLYRLDAGYPALVLDPGGAPVEGEYIEGVDPGTLRLVDLYEGVEEGLYQRVPCEVTIGLRKHTAEVYVMADAPQRGRLIPGGVWRNPIRRGRA